MERENAKPRLARPHEVAAVTRLSENADAPYTELLGYPPLPAIENYAPRIAAGEVWLLEPAPAPPELRHRGHGQGDRLIGAGPRTAN